MADMMRFLLLFADFDLFGSAPSSAKPQDFMGAFLGPGNVGQPEPFLHAARSPSPTMQNMGLGKACACVSVWISCVCVFVAAFSTICSLIVAQSYGCIALIWQCYQSLQLIFGLSWMRCSCSRQYVIFFKGYYMRLRPAMHETSEE